VTTREWLLTELRRDIDAAQDVASVKLPGFGSTGSWSMRLHMLRRCVALVEQGPAEPTAAKGSGAV
jgi:hypothetical protein